MSYFNTVYRYNAICYDSTTSNNVAHDVWSPGTFSSCPFNNSNHTFQFASITASVSDGNLITHNNTEGTSGLFGCYGFEFDIPAGPDTELVDLDVITFPYPIRVNSCRFIFENNNAGDYFEVIAFSVPPYGTIVSEVSGGSTLYLDPISFSIVKLGMVIILNDGVNRQELGECIGIDSNTLSVTVEEIVSYTFSSGTPIYIGFNLAKNVKVSASVPNFTIGETVVSSLLIPTSQNIHLRYKNMTAVAKSLVVYVDLFR
jgi:hypothetical protein